MRLLDLALGSWESYRAQGAATKVPMVQRSSPERSCMSSPPSNAWRASARLHVTPKEVNDVRKLLNRPRPENRPRRLPISQAEVERLRDRAWLEASLPRIGL